MRNYTYPYKTTNYDDQNNCQYSFCLKLVFRLFHRVSVTILKNTQKVYSITSSIAAHRSEW